MSAPYGADSLASMFKKKPLGIQGSMPATQGMTAPTAPPPVVPPASGATTPPAAPAAPASPYAPNTPGAYYAAHPSAMDQGEANAAYGQGSLGAYMATNPTGASDAHTVESQGKLDAAAASAAASSAAQAPQPYLEDLYKQFGSAYMGPTYTGAAMGGLGQQLGQPGQAEQFYQQAQNTETDPYYQRLQHQGMDALNQQMQARGHFNSGGAIAGLGNFESGLQAQQYHQMGDLANQAQSQGQARAGLLGSLSNSADANDLNRLNSLFNVAGQAQGLNQQGTNSMLNSQMGIDQTGAGLEGIFYGQGGQLSGDAQKMAADAGAKAAEASAHGEQATQNMIWDGAKWIFKTATGK